jgi:peptidoglycan/xylan/chitin deacetylase (PgdA/CDA1 family)
VIAQSIPDSPCLRIVAYHYVRDLPRTQFPAIKGILVDQFRIQVDQLRQSHEMATLESAQAFLAGNYDPKRDLCLLTFDDGLKEHYTEVTPILSERKIEGLFFLPTVCIEEHRVVMVHKNHFLMASLKFDDYRRSFMNILAEVAPGVDCKVDGGQAARTYRFDDQPTAEFKYMLNFRLAPQIRMQVLDRLFEEHLGDEAKFARELYVSWEEAQAMQDAGMMLGGHSHQHIALATLSPEEQKDDLHTCSNLLRSHLRPQSEWPFCYPYGNPVDSFDNVTVDTLRKLNFSCAFTTAVGTNLRGSDRYRLQRIDTTEVKFGERR